MNDVRRFGAKGDGITNDTAAIRAAMIVDLPRLHRFLVEHGSAPTHVRTLRICVACGVGTWAPAGQTPTPHAPDCEWVALVEMTKGEEA